jgi:hypothetical protein
VAQLEAESRERKISKSDVVRERLRAGGRAVRAGLAFEAIADLVGSVDDDLPADLSARRKHYLQVSGYGRKRPPIRSS